MIVVPNFLPNFLPDLEQDMVIFKMDVWLQSTVN